MSNRPLIEPKYIIRNSAPIVIAGLSKDYLFDNPMDPSAQWKQLHIYLANLQDSKTEIAYGICFNLDDGRGIGYLCKK